MPGVSIVVDEASPLLARVRSAAMAQGLALVGARAGAQLVRTHLFGLDGQRHKGGRHYYAQAARSVNTARMPQGAVINVPQTGFRQRLNGGTINAKPGKALTIPEDDSAVGHRAGEFNDLHLARFINRNGSLQAALVRNASTPIRIRRRTLKDGTVKTSITPGQLLGGEIMYWLVKSVTQKPDPTVLPRRELIIERVRGAIGGRLLRVGDRSQNKEGSES